MGSVAAGREASQDGDVGSGSAALGCIRVYSLLTGRQVAVIQQRLPWKEQRPWPPSAARRQERLAAAAAAALKHVTSLLFDEHTHRLYTGTADGRLQSWAVG